MRIATLTADRRGAVDAVLSEVARRLTAEGFGLAGVVRAPATRDLHDHCDMDLAVLPLGVAVRISQDLGKAATSCRLDAAALEEAAAAVETSLARGPVDLLIVNKFGQREAEGRGFRPAIALALERGIPVLVGVPEGHRAAFARFAEDLAVALPVAAEPVLDWCRGARTSAAA